MSYFIRLGGRGEQGDHERRRPPQQASKRRRRREGVEWREDTPHTPLPRRWMAAVLSPVNKTQ